MQKWQKPLSGNKGSLKHVNINTFWSANEQESKHTTRRLEPRKLSNDKEAGWELVCTTATQTYNHKQTNCETDLTAKLEQSRQASQQDSK